MKWRMPTSLVGKPTEVMRLLTVAVCCNFWKVTMAFKIVCNGALEVLLHLEFSVLGSCHFVENEGSGSFYLGTLVFCSEQNPKLFMLDVCSTYLCSLSCYVSLNAKFSCFELALKEACGKAVSITGSFSKVWSFWIVAIVVYMWIPTFIQLAKHSLLLLSSVWPCSQW